MSRIFQRVLFSLFLALWGTALLCTAPGCGKKGPPVPPAGNGGTPPAPTALKYTLTDRDLTLSWTCAAFQNTAQGPAVEGFEVFMATRAPDGCQGCPFMFKSLGVVPMPRKHFVYTLDQDLDYYFRVQTLGRDNVKSKVSETLYIELP